MSTIRLLVATGAVGAALLVWMLRFSLVPAGENGAAYLLDRWTGEITVVHGKLKYPVRSETGR